jgi:hypothetical protein
MLLGCRGGFEKRPYNQALLFSDVNFKNICALAAKIKASIADAQGPVKVVSVGRARHVFLASQTPSLSALVKTDATPRLWLFAKKLGIGFD